MTAPSSADALPQPFSESLRAALARALAATPAHKTGVLTVGVSHSGAEVSIGWRPRPGVTVSGYGAGLWRGGWAGGVKGEVIW